MSDNELDGRSDGIEALRLARAHPAADLYERWTLDIVPTAGPVAAAIFESDPQPFKHVSRNTVGTLATIRFRTGYDESFLDKSTRLAVISPILGESDEVAHDSHSDFHLAASAVRRSAAVYAERSYDTGEEQLRNAFLDSAVTLRSYIETVEGAVLYSANDRTTKQFESTVDVLQDATFAGGLGVSPAPKAPWPRFGSFGGSGAVVIGAVFARLGSEPQSPSPVGTPSTEPDFISMFVKTQRVAHYGAWTIDAIMAELDQGGVDADVRAMINVAYRWFTAHRDRKADTTLGTARLHE